MLIAAESIITYRRRYRSHAQLETMLDLLVLDAGNPRALAYQVSLLAEAVSSLPDASANSGALGGKLSQAERLVLEINALVRLADTNVLSTAGVDGRRQELLAVLDRLSLALEQHLDGDRRRALHRAPAAALIARPERSDRHRCGGVRVIYEVTHRTEYRYEAPVSASYGKAHLLPRERPGQWCRQSNVYFDPGPDDQREHVDYFGNRALTFSILQSHTSLTVVGVSTVEVQEPPALSLLANQPWELVRSAIASAASPASIAAGEFVLDSPRVAASVELSGFAAPCFSPGRPVGEAVADLVHRIHEEFEYEPGVTTVTSTIDELMATRQGVCQDFAHLAIGCLRSVGLAARYVSGYLETVPPSGRASSSRRRPVPRLGVAVRAGRRLDRHRPDQRPLRQRPVRHGGVGP